jgi:hypothetical protein
VTVFHEKTVEDAVRSIIPDAIILQANADGYKFSLNDVLLNTIQVAMHDKQSIIVWTTCDVVFENSFFANIIRCYSEKFSGTSHPHIEYRNLEDLREVNNNFFYNNKRGIDTVFFSTQLLSSDNVKKIIEKYRFINWGFFEQFLVGIAMRYSDIRINLCEHSFILKIENDRDANNENKAYFDECIKTNMPVLHDFFSSENIPDTLTQLDVCNAQFSIVKSRRVSS